MEPGGESQVERAIKALPKAGRGYEAVVLNPKAKLLDQVKELMRLRHYSIRTEQSYSDWIRRYIKFHGLRSREELTPGTEKVEQFLSDLAVNGNVAASTQNQAFNALLFLYREVLRQPFESVKAVRAKVRMTKVSDLSLCWKFRPWIQPLPLCAFKSSKT